MSNITGRAGLVTRQVDGVDTVVVGIREWSLDYDYDMLDVTEFADTAPTAKSFLPILYASSGTLAGNHTDGSEQLTPGSNYNITLCVDDNTAYYGSAYISGKGVNIQVEGEAAASYKFQFTGKIYILGAEVVVDGDFSGDGTDWDVSDADVAYDASNNEIDWTGEADVVPASNDVITNATEYWTQMTVCNESGTSTMILKLGTAAGTTRSADGTYTEMITANSTTFTLSGDTDGAISLSKISIRPVQN